MAGAVKGHFLEELARRFGRPKSLPGSYSLFSLGDGHTIVYTRYSRLHPGNRAFFGLRQSDMELLQGKESFICLLWDGQEEPLFIPYYDYEHVFRSVPAAEDGQYKVQVFLGQEGAELYVARAGRFKVDQDFGWEAVAASLARKKEPTIPDLGHSDIQGILAWIGSKKGFCVWVPAADRQRLPERFSPLGAFVDQLPDVLVPARLAAEEVDVMWLVRGRQELRALFEVEPSTPIYSGLLRLNDVMLAVPSVRPTYNIVSNDNRRDLYVRQVQRPTFVASGLSERCCFLDYADVYHWHERVAARGAQERRDASK
jgi:hypothetical protein